MYSDIIHIDINCTPAKNVIATISDVQPAVKLFSLNANDIKAYIIMHTEIAIEISPNAPTNFNGFVEKLIIPSAANFNIFFSGYLVSPANLSFLSYSYGSCLNPTQLHNPLKN